ncbi:MAG: ribonuclease HII [Chthonomonadetes bacterium]|nr:ribonuclease HII [Chthonomonadetes bacterium]
MDPVLAASAHSHRQITPLVAGVDEVGRGCLAGPVVAACVALPDVSISSLPPFIRDSKKLSPLLREQACRWIYRHAPVVSVGLATVEEIERMNILHASLLAMRRAVENAGIVPQMLLVDGTYLPDALPCPAEAVVDGDARVPVISAASIVAKVVRDHLMTQLHCLYPQYGFAQHKGYATPAHRQAILRLGLCPQHRVSFCANLLALPLGGEDG